MRSLCTSQGDEDNGEQGAWFVLSALGLFSTVPGSLNLVLGSPIFRHVRIWRGHCKVGGTGQCDYGRDDSSFSIGSKSVHTFPPDSSYLDLVALGTSPEVSKVVEVTLNGAPLPLSDPSSFSSSSSPRKSRLLFQGNSSSFSSPSSSSSYLIFLSQCACVCVCVCVCACMCVWVNVCVCLYV